MYFSMLFTPGTQKGRISEFGVCKEVIENVIKDFLFKRTLKYLGKNYHSRPGVIQVITKRKDL